jgi:putative endonuclease
MLYYAYILQSLKDRKYYIGSTSEVAERLNFHNSGRQRSTKNRIPFILIYSEELPNKEEGLSVSKQGVFDRIDASATAFAQGLQQQALLKQS